MVMVENKPKKGIENVVSIEEVFGILNFLFVEAVQNRKMYKKEEKLGYIDGLMDVALKIKEYVGCDN